VIEGSDLRIYFEIAGFATCTARLRRLLGFPAGAISAQPRSMSSKANELASRLKRFATRVVIFARAMPTDPRSQVLARQLSGSGTAQSANYHAARRARSRAEFIAKLGVAAEEADETEHWLTVIRDAHVISTTTGLRELGWLLDESRQLRAILVASTRTARANQRNHQ
jgi:four helix bundle protein